MGDTTYENISPGKDFRLEEISSARPRTQTAAQVKKGNAETAPPLPPRPPGAADRCCRWTVCLGVLCVLLLGLSIGLAVWLLTERDHLLTNHTNLLQERDQLQTNHTNLLQERDQLQTNQSNLLQERDQLLTNQSNLLEEKDQLLTNYSNLHEEKDQLLIKYRNLCKETSHPLCCNESLETQMRPRCPDGWDLFGCNCYHVNKEFRNWTDSRQGCQSLGGDLVIIKTPEKQRFITEKYYGGWIGMRKGNGTWIWIDDTPVMIWYWNPGQPDDSADCVLIHEGGTTNQNWYDSSCHGGQWSICEKSAI